MTYNYIKNIDKDKDLIVSCPKGDLKELQTFISIDNLDFEGEHATFQLLYGPKGNKVYALGLGEEKDAVKIGEAFRKLCFDTKKYWKGAIQVYAENLSEDDIKKAVIGFEMASYEVGQFKSKSEEQKDITITFASSKDIS
ncbi:MAG TPA: M17 family peptidase N-terminal domain-containing protein, partial [Flavobacteriaceae bacterium]